MSRARVDNQRADGRVDRHLARWTRGVDPIFRTPNGARMLPKCGPGLIAYLIVSKCGDAMPTYRAEKHFRAPRCSHADRAATLDRSSFAVSSSGAAPPGSGVWRFPKPVGLPRRFPPTATRDRGSRSVIWRAKRLPQATARSALLQSPPPSSTAPPSPGDSVYLKNSIDELFWMR